MVMSDVAVLMSNHVTVGVGGSAMRSSLLHLSLVASLCTYGTAGAADLWKEAQIRPERRLQARADRTHSTTSASLCVLSAMVPLRHAVRRIRLESLSYRATNPILRYTQP